MSCRAGRMGSSSEAFLGTPLRGGPIPTFRPAPPHDRVCAYVRGHIVDGPV